MNSEIMFYLLAGMILVFSVLTVTSRKILRAAVYLLFVLISTAAIYFMLEYTFLAAVQLTVYAGGIVVLIIFSVLLTSHISERAAMAPFKHAIFAALSAIAGMIVTILALLQFVFIPTSQPAIGSDVKTIGAQLINYGNDGYALPFEVISILLLAAMIGAIVVAKKEAK